MTLQVVPVQAVPSQSVSCVLGRQACTINIRTLSTGLYIDLYVSNALIIGGVICEHRSPIVRDAYLGFIGDLAFCDMQGITDPVYTGLGTRYLLFYLSRGAL